MGLRKFRVYTNLIMKVLQEGWSYGIEVIENNLPEDAEIVNVYMNNNEYLFIVLESKEWDSYNVLDVKEIDSPTFNTVYNG